MQTLVLVRHGATAWNANGYCQGRKDVVLSADGREQVARLKELFAARGLSFDRVYASPLQRAVETARGLGCEPEILDDLIEIDRGHWEGHDPAEIQRRWGKLRKQWYVDPTGLAMPGGEAFDDLWERGARVLARLEADGGAHVLACGHKAINRVVVARALGRPARGVWDIPQFQAGWSRLVRDGAGAAWRAETVGDVAHLPEEMRSDT